MSSVCLLRVITDKFRVCLCVQECPDWSVQSQVRLAVNSLFSLTASLVQIWSASQKPASEPANCLLLSTSPWKTWTSGSSPLTEAVSEDTSVLEWMCSDTWHSEFLNACCRSYFEQFIHAYVGILSFFQLKYHNWIFQWLFVDVCWKSTIIYG